MALDPSISLGAKPVPMDMASAAEKGMSLRLLQGQIPLQEQQLRQGEANLAATQASTQNILAQNEGIKAESAQRARDTMYQKWITENSHRFVTKDKDGKDIIDHQGFSADLARNGYYDKAQAIAASDIANKRQEIAADTDLVTKAEKTQELQKTMLAHASNIVSNMPAAQAQQTWDTLAKGSENLIPGISSIFGQYDPARVKALAVATMTPEQQKRLEMDQKAQALEFEKVGATPEGRSPDSQISKTVMAAYRAANPDYNGPNLSLYDIKTNFPEFAAQVARSDVASTVTAETRMAVERTLAEQLGTQTWLNKGAQAGQAMLSGTSGKTYAGERVTDIIAKYIDSDPKVKELDAAIQEYKKATGRDLDTNQSLQGVINVLKTESQNITGKIKTSEKQASTSKMKTGSREKPAETATSTANPTGDKVRVRAPDGQIGSVPASVLKDAIAAGYTKL